MSADQARSIYEFSQNFIASLGQVFNNHAIMRWEGYETPFGATIDGVEIRQAKHGIITSENGTPLGVYEPLDEPDDGIHHAIRVMTNGQEIIAPNGQPCPPAPPSPSPKK